MTASTFSETTTQHETDPLAQLQMEAGARSQGMSAEDLSTHHQDIWEARYGFPAPTFIYFKLEIAKGHLRAMLNVVRGHRQRAPCFPITAQGLGEVSHSRALPATHFPTWL